MGMLSSSRSVCVLRLYLYYDSEVCRTAMRFSLIFSLRAFSSCSTHAYHPPPPMVTKIPKAFARVMVRSKITTESNIVKTCFTFAGAGGPM